MLNIVVPAHIIVYNMSTVIRGQSVFEVPKAKITIILPINYEDNLQASKALKRFYVTSPKLLEIIYNSDLFYLRIIVFRLHYFNNENLAVKT